MTTDSVASLTHRLLSLEDIIRQQEQTISAVLQRLRDVEQYATAESRSREQALQQLYARLEDRGGSTAEAVNRMQATLQSHNDRLSALQADVQGQGAALRGVSDKNDAAFRGMEQRLQAEVSGAHQRALTGETASAEAMRALQAQVQSLANTLQAIEARSHGDIVALQQQMGSEIAGQRQRSDNLESAMRDALHNVHASLSEDVRSAGAQQRGDLEGAVQRINQGLEALDQRTRIDMNQLHSSEQTDVSDLRRRIGELESNVRELIQAARNGLSSEIAGVMQHIQAQDTRQATAHQAVLQELAKHDSQIETVDLNWRGSVTDLSAKIGEDVAAAQQRSAARDQALQLEINAVQERCVTATGTLQRDLTSLADAVQENAVKSVQELYRVLSVQEQRLIRVADDCTSMQDYLKTFTAHVDVDVAQLKQVMEAAVRAAHSDLLERINMVSASTAMHPYWEMFRGEVNRGLTKLWEDAKSVFLTPRSLNEIQAQLATLESAVRVELCALAERSNDVWRSLDELRIAHLRAAQQPITAATVIRTAAEHNTCRQSAATSTDISAMATPVTTSPSRTPQIQDPAVKTDASKTEAREGTTAATTATTGLWSSMPGETSRATSDTAKVEEMDWNSDEQNERLQEHEEEKGLRASSQRLRISQAQEFSKYADANQTDNALTTNITTATAARIEDASERVSSAGRLAAESAKAAELAQDGSTRVASALPLAPQRVNVLEEALTMQLKQDEVIQAIAAPVQQDQVLQQPKSRQEEEGSKASTVPFCTKVTRSLSASLTTLTAREAEDNVGVSGAVAFFVPNTLGQPAIYHSLCEEALATSEKDLIEFTGGSTGEVLASHSNRTGCTSPASVQMQPVTTGPSTIPTKFVTPSNALVRSMLSENVVLKPSPRGSDSSEFLLPTHQFVRKREYNSFKDFTKREIDSIWVEIVNMRRTRGLSKEELLLYMSQSKEQMLSTVLKVVQQQEEEMLRMLASIKAQLSKIHSDPDLVRDFRVFPIDNGQHLEEFVRSLSMNVKATPVTVMQPPPSTSTVVAEPLQGRAQKALSRSFIHEPALPRAEVIKKAVMTSSGQSLPPTPRGNHSGVDSTVSSACSSLPLQPQFILPIVRRDASPPRLRLQPEEVLYVSTDEMGSPILNSSRRCETSHCSAPKPASLEGRSLRVCTKDAFLDQKAPAPAPHLLEPEKLSSKCHPTDMSSASVARPPSLGSLPPAAHASRGPEGGSDPCRFAPSHVDRTVAPQGQLCGLSESSARDIGSDEAKRYLKASKSPRNPTGSSFHLNPLHEIGNNDYPPPAELGVRRSTTSAAVPSPVMAAQFMDSTPQLREYDLRQSGSRSHQYPLRDSPSSRAAAHANESVVVRLTDTVADKYPSANMSQGSDIYWQSVENMRPPRSTVRRRFAGTAETVPAQHDASPSFARGVGHLYKLQTPVSEQLYAPSPQLPSPLRRPQQRDYRPGRDRGDNSVPTGEIAPNDIIHLRPYTRPVGRDTGDGTVSLGPSMSLYRVYTPNVNSSGGRNCSSSARDVQSF